MAGAITVAQPAGLRFMAVADIELLYRQQLSDTDRRLLGSVAGADVPVRRGARILGCWKRPCSADDHAGRLGRGVALPTFAIAVNRTAAALETAAFVEERPSRQRVRYPVFDRGGAADAASPIPPDVISWPTPRFLHPGGERGSPGHAPLAGGAAAGFSELDPGRLAEMLEVVPNLAERAGITASWETSPCSSWGCSPDHPPTLGGGAATDRLLRVSG